MVKFDKTNNLLARFIEASKNATRKPENWFEYQKLNRKRYYEKRR